MIEWKNIFLLLLCFIILSHCTPEQEKTKEAIE